MPSPLVDSFNDVTATDEYVLPPLTHGSYFTEPNGQGQQLQPGDIITETTTIYIYADDGNCQSETSFTVEVVYSFKYPKFFTPNGDGFNDVWEIEVQRLSPSNTKVYIYDRFGKLLFISTVGVLGWDGTYNGKPLPSTDYWFEIELLNGEIVKAHFTLKR
jgi:gliding motility-associated-like protein